MFKWKAVHVNGGWYVAKTDIFGRVTEYHDGGDCGTREKAELMAQQYNMGY